MRGSAIEGFQRPQSARGGAKQIRLFAAMRRGIAREDRHAREFMKANTSDALSRLSRLSRLSPLSRPVPGVPMRAALVPLVPLVLACSKGSSVSVPMPQCPFFSYWNKNPIRNQGFWSKRMLPHQTLVSGFIFFFFLLLLLLLSFLFFFFFFVLVSFSGTT